MKQESEIRQFTDLAGRKFHYAFGRRVYLDGGADVGTPVPFLPQSYVRPEPRKRNPSPSPAPGLLLYYRKLSSNLEKFLGIAVSVETLLSYEGLIGIVLQLLPEGRTYEERQELREKIARIAGVSRKWAMHQVTAKFVCCSCKRCLGFEALRLGKEFCDQWLEEAHHRCPDRLITVLPPGISAVCHHCGSKYWETQSEEMTLEFVGPEMLSM